MCDINRNNHSHTNGWRSLGLLGVTTHVITPVPSCLSSLITIYMLYCLIKTPASLCALDVDMQGACVCVRARARAHTSFISPSSRAHFSVGSRRLHLARFISAFIEGQFIWSSLRPSTTAEQFEALKPAVTFFLSFFTTSSFNQTCIDG